MESLAVWNLWQRATLSPIKRPGEVPEQYVALFQATSAYFQEIEGDVDPLSLKPLRPPTAFSIHTNGPKPEKRHSDIAGNRLGKRPRFNSMQGNQSLKAVVLPCWLAVHW